MTERKVFMVNGEKVSKTQIYKMIRAEDSISNNELYVDFIDHELELLNRKSATRGTNKSSAENETIKAEILEMLALTNKMRVADMIAEFAKNGKTYSSSKITSLLTQLKNDNLVERIEEKRVAYFQRVIED